MDADAYLDELPDAVVVVSADGIVTYANRAAERLGRANGDPLTGQPLDQALPLREANGRGWWACSAKLRRLPGVRGVPARRLDLVQGDRVVKVEFAATFLRGDDRRLAEVLCVLRDAAPLRRADAAVAELITTLAHELRSPLTSVKGFTATLLHRWDRFTDEQKRHMLTTVNADADRVTRLIKELLDVSRIETGRLELRREMVDLPAVAGGVIGRFELAGGGHRFDISFPEGFPELYADRDKLEQVLTNLVENAVKYTEDGTVTIVGDTAGDVVEVAVRDQGDGIPAEQLPLIFTKFYRRPGVRSGAPSGTGLGLYIARGLVEAHGGKIWAHSQPGAGLEVRFRLPRGGLELAGIN